MSPEEATVSGFSACITDSPAGEHMTSFLLSEWQWSVRGDQSFADMLRSQELSSFLIELSSSLGDTGCKPGGPLRMRKLGSAGALVLGPGNDSEKNIKKMNIA